MREKFPIELFQNKKTGSIILIKVIPKSSRVGPLGLLAGNPLSLKWGVNSAPEDGKANAELLKQIAKYFDLKRAKVSILSGEKSQLKTILLEDFDSNKFLNS
jgi:uncharacterized protein